MDNKNNAKQSLIFNMSWIVHKYLCPLYAWNILEYS